MTDEPQEPEDMIEVDLSMVLDMFQGLARAIIGGSGAPQLALDEVDDIEVSTIQTLDLAHIYETAVRVDDDGDVHPVERYVTEEEALAGHARWVAVMRDERPTLLIDIGFPGVIPPEEFIVPEFSPDSPRRGGERRPNPQRKDET